MAASATTEQQLSSETLDHAESDSASPSTPTAGSDANNIPQWKRDLIQRRKSNISRTIGANQAVTTHSSKQDTTAAELLPVRPTTSSSSSFASSKHHQTSTNTPIVMRNSSQTPAVAANNSGGHYTQQQQQLVAQMQQFQRADEKGIEENLNSTNTGTQITTKTGNNATIQTQHTQQQQTTTTNVDGKSPFLLALAPQLHSDTDASCHATTETVVAAPPQAAVETKRNSKFIKKPQKAMVAVQETPPTTTTTKEFDFDPSEELQYGPGIVSKLRCRYLSLTLRQAAAGGGGKSDSCLRRATSLNNLLDDEEDDEDDDVTGKNRYSEPDYAKYRNSATVTAAVEEYSDAQQRSARQVKRGNDSLKRARSVEALLCDKTAWQTAKLDLKLPPTPTLTAPQVTIDEKITNSRDRGGCHPPKRLTSIIDDTERPPPDLVRQTLKLFEATANRRRSGGGRKTANGEVATKIANYKSIISEQSPKKLSLDLKTKSTANLLHPSSPISSIAKKFDEQPIMSSTPNRMGSTPDIIPRSKHSDKKSSLQQSTPKLTADSPVTDLSKKIGDLCLTADLSPSTDDSDGLATKRVSKLALENIAKAGTTLHFSFQPAIATATPATGGQQQQKQIGVIRPLVAEPQQQQSDEDELSAKLLITNLNSISNNSNINSNSSNHKITLTSREIEKNLINEKKNNEQAASLLLVETSETAAMATATTSPAWVVANKQKKKTRTPPTAVVENNTMVFNFKDRKEVPDYIENDGLVFKKRRELPKPNESGFVILDNLSLETSTDNDDYWTMGPPSPCDVEFENANIVINGKSSIRHRHTKDLHLRVKFNDTLTSTFEYPSESSILEDYTSDYSCNDSMDTLDTSSQSTNSHVAVEEVIQLPHNTTRMLGNLSLDCQSGPKSITFRPPIPPNKPAVLRNPQYARFLLNDIEEKNRQKCNYKFANDDCIKAMKCSTSLGSYTPIKAQINNKFELGITRSASSSPAAQVPITGELDTEPQQDDSIQYLKPAHDDHTVAYSEGIQKTDILF